MKIMICEQDVQQVKLIKNVLNNYKFRHIVPKKDHNIYKLAVEQKPSLIILNENFYSDSQNEIMDKLRSNPQTKYIPVIYISNKYDLNEKLKKFSNDSYVQLLSEPFHLKLFRHSVNRWTTFRSLYVKQ